MSDDEIKITGKKDQTPQPPWECGLKLCRKQSRGGNNINNHNSKVFFFFYLKEQCLLYDAKHESNVELNVCLSL